MLRHGCSRLLPRRPRPLLRLCPRFLSAEAAAPKPKGDSSDQKNDVEVSSSSTDPKDIAEFKKKQEYKTITNDLLDAVIPYGRNRLILFVDDDRWRYKLITVLNAMHMGFWYVNWLYIFPEMSSLPTMVAPVGLSLAALLSGFFYWQASQSIAGVFYNRISQEVELLQYSAFGARNEPLSISFRDIQLSQRSTDHFLFVKRRNDKLFMTIDRSGGTVVHEKLLLACLSGEQLFVNKILATEEVTQAFKKAAPLQQDSIKEGEEGSGADQSSKEGSSTRSTTPTSQVAKFAESKFIPPKKFKHKKKGNRRR